MLWLFLGLVLILASCEGFAISIEHLGRRLKLGANVVGNFMAAFGTALPEALFTIIAIVSGRGDDVGIGAILGAPFMLGTFVFCLTGLTVFIHAASEGKELTMAADIRHLSKDMRHFLILMGAAVLGAFITVRWVKVLLGIVMVGNYIYHVFRIDFKMRDEATEDDEHLPPLHFSPRSPNPTLFPIISQVAVSLVVLVFGSRVFIFAVGEVAAMVGVSPLILSLVISPIASELPELINSIKWVIAHKDALALGNITGAMIFQSSILVGIGMIFTSWKASQIDPWAWVSVGMVVASAAIVYLVSVFRKRLKFYVLLAGGIFYVAFLTFVFVSI
ncbi:MAG: sodium:calcium antiporter [bacterium]